MIDLSKKVVLITGSSSGLGKGLAFSLCQAGARVVINGRNPMRIRETLASFEKQGLKATGITADVTIPEDTRQMVEKCIKTHGSLDILINNAGIGSSGSFQETSPDCFEKIIRTNLLGSLFITRYALPYIRKSGGSILFISSLAALHGLPYISVYSASKMALTAVAQMLRLELNHSNVHVGIAYVGFLRNDVNKRVLGPDGQMVMPGARPEKITQSIEKASGIIIRALKKRKKNVYLTASGKLLKVITTLSPGLYRFILRRKINKMESLYVAQKVNC